VKSKTRSIKEEMKKL